jgi:hypothetical protein
MVNTLSKGKLKSIYLFIQPSSNSFNNYISSVFSVLGSFNGSPVAKERLIRKKHTYLFNISFIFLGFSYFVLFCDRCLLCCPGWSWTTRLKQHSCLSLLRSCNSRHEAPCPVNINFTWHGNSHKEWGPEDTNEPGCF